MPFPANNFLPTMLPSSPFFPLELPRRALQIGTIGVSVLVAGCANTAYQRQQLDLPSQWPSQAQASAKAGARDAGVRRLVQADRWWQALGDPQLDRLIALALERNNNLAAAAYKVRNAQLQAGNAAGNLWPTPGAGLNANASRPLEGEARTQRSYSTSVSLNWEVDLWGKLAAQQRMADWEASATEEDRQAAAQALIATVAKTYWQLAVMDARIATQDESLRRAAQSLQLAETQYRAGAISGLDIAQARQGHASQRASATSLVQQRTELRNAMAILFDAPPGQLPSDAQRPRLPDMARLPSIPAGVPAELLARRPDLRAAELRLRSTLTQVDVTRTSYYPSLSLTGSLGTSSVVLSQLLGNPAGSLGLAVALPFLKWGEMQRNTAIARNSYEQATITFRQTLWQAMGEVDNALSGRVTLQQQVRYLRDALVQAERAEQRAQVRYRAGATPLKTWLDAQEARRSAANALQDAELAQLVNLVTLYQALGGSPVLPAVPVPQTPAQPSAAQSPIAA